MSEEKPTAGSRKRSAAVKASGVAPDQPLALKAQPRKRAAKPTKRVAKVMLYTHPKVAKKIKEIALHADRKANDVYLDAIDLYLKKAGHTGIKHFVES